MWSVCPRIPSRGASLAIVHQRGFTRPREFLATALGFETEGVGGDGVTQGETGLFASGFFFLVDGNHARL